MKVKSPVLLFFTLIIVGLIGYLVYQSRKMSLFHPNYGVYVPNEYPVFGIDVSHHQGKMDYEMIRTMEDGGDSIQFVYIKATEGADFTDHDFERNATGFAKQQIDHGFYHYFKPNTSATQQALFFCQTIGKFNTTLIPVLDVEEKGDLTATQLIDSVSVFTSVVKEILETDILLYTYTSFYHDYFKNKLTETQIFWLAYYGLNHDFMQNKQVVAWQFTDEGTVNGIRGKVDLNVAKKDFFEKVKRSSPK